METENMGVGDTPTASEPQTFVPNPAPKKNRGLKLLITVVILACLAVGAYYLQTKTLPPQPPTPPITEEPEQPGQPSDTEPLVSGIVEWRYPSRTYFDIVTADFSAASEFYILGTFKSGKYDGKELVLAIIPYEGPGPGIMMRMVRVTNNNTDTFVVLEKHSDAITNWNDLTQIKGDKLTFDSNYTLSDLTPPKTITTPSGISLQLAELAGFDSSYRIFNQTGLDFAFENEKVGAVYTTPENLNNVDLYYQRQGFYVKAPDWGVYTYKYEPVIISSNNVPNIKWSDNTINEDEYVYTSVVGCGTNNYATVVTKQEVGFSTDLQVIGTATNDSSVYGYKNLNHQTLKDAYEKDYNPYGAEKDSYEIFAASRPIFYWIDPFNRLVQFREKKYLVSAAECGKPVIYLYPTKAQNVSVEVSPTSGFTYTEPEYNNGWKVFATPQGKITNLADGISYPYLFWEGHGGAYQTPDKGFVVSQNDVSNLFDEKLSQFGLITQEIADFKEYWMPYFTGSPYYFITFMGNPVMNRIAPLTVTPKPDTIIRVLMDFKPLQEFVKVEGFKIQTPVRKGFTVVEWGGVKPD